MPPLPGAPAAGQRLQSAATCTPLAANGGGLLHSLSTDPGRGGCPPRRAHVSHQYACATAQLKQTQDQLSDLVALLRIKSPSLLAQLQKMPSWAWQVGEEGM